MPLYEYECDGCGLVYEVRHGMKDDPFLRCPGCKSGKASKMISGGSGVHFKGTGFYGTDYKETT